MPRWGVCPLWCISWGVGDIKNLARCTEFPSLLRVSSCVEICCTGSPPKRDSVALIECRPHTSLDCVRSNRIRTQKSAQRNERLLVNGQKLTDGQEPHPHPSFRAEIFLASKGDLTALSAQLFFYFFGNPPFFFPMEGRCGVEPRRDELHTYERPLFRLRRRNSSSLPLSLHIPTRTASLH